MKTAVKKDKSTPEKAGFWNCVEASADQVHEWPDWKRDVLAVTTGQANKSEGTHKSVTSGSAAQRSRK